MKKSNPKYQAVYNALKERAAACDEGARLPSIKALGAEFGVSLATLNSALDLLAQDGLIRREPKRGIYCAKPAAEPRQGRVTLLLPGDREPLFVAIITTLHRALRRHGIESQLALYELDSASEAHELELLARDGRTDGVIYLPTFDTVRCEELLRELASVKPVIQFDRTFTSRITPFVGYDCFGACYAATRYLIELGHTNIGLIHASNDNMKKPSGRIAGFLRAMSEADLPVDPRRTIVYDVRNPDLSNGVVEILSSRDCPTAFFAVNGVYIPRLMRKAAFVGKRIPDDISFICLELGDVFESLPLAATYFAQPTREVLEKTAELLLRMLRGETVSNDEYLFSAELVIGESCRELPGLKVQGLH